MTNTLKLLIVYYSQTGNTEKMARAVEEGAKSVVGINVEVKFFVKPEELAEADAIIFGMPTYYHDMSMDMKTLLEGASKDEIDLTGKVGAAFGSYGWSGEAVGQVRGMLEEMKIDLVDEGLKVKFVPDSDALGRCYNLGLQLAEKAKQLCNGD